MLSFLSCTTKMLQRNCVLACCDFLPSIEDAVKRAYICVKDGMLQGPDSALQGLSVAVVHSESTALRRRNCHRWLQRLSAVALQCQMATKRPGNVLPWGSGEDVSVSNMVP